MSVIDELLDLQEQDSVIKALEKQVHDIPKRRKLEQEKLDDYQRELDQAREALDRAQKVEAQSQLDSDQQAAQIAKYEKQRQEVKTNNEYAALGRQIDSCRRVKAEYDERVAKAREHIEAVQENIAMFEARLAEESAQVETYVDELRAQLSNDEYRLYDMIWKRTIASQMTNARGKKKTVVVVVDERAVSGDGGKLYCRGL